jgi:uncharacterized membrane protein
MHQASPVSLGAVTPGERLEPAMVTAVAGTDGGRLILSPHAPMSPAGALSLFLLVSSAILSVAIVCALLGAWQVLPMSSLVVLAVGAGLLSGYRRTQIEEVVSVAGETVAIEKHLRRTNEHYEFPRGWAQVVLEEPPIPTPDMSHLFIRAYGRQVEIGAFLDYDEKHDLASTLRRLMGPGRSFDACLGS